MTNRPTDGIAVDASCICDRESIRRDGYFHGPVEWQAVDLLSGERIHFSLIYPQGTINLAEFLAIVDVLTLLHANGNTATPVYSDSLTAIAWVRRRRLNTKMPTNERTALLMRTAQEGVRWLIANAPPNPVLFWDGRLWGENPADFGRKQ